MRQLSRLLRISFSKYEWKQSDLVFRKITRFSASKGGFMGQKIGLRGEISADTVIDHSECFGFDVNEKLGLL